MMSRDCFAFQQFPVNHRISSSSSISSSLNLFKSSSNSSVDTNPVSKSSATSTLRFVDRGNRKAKQVEVKNNETTDADSSMLYTMLGLIFVVAGLSALDRIAMSVALVPMTEEFGFTDTTKGAISSFFSVGYGFAILPAGLLLASVSPRLFMTIGVALWSTGTILTPFTAAQENMSILLGARALVGASESVVIPSVQRLIASWVPVDKKALSIGVLLAGFQSGTIGAYLLSPYLVEQLGDWRDLFYVYGGAGLLFLIPWLALAKDSPNDLIKSESQVTIATDNRKKFISPLESVDAKQDQDEDSSPLRSAIDLVQAAPWGEFVRSKAVWAMFLAHAANNWGLYNNLNWGSTFYSEQYGLNIKESAFLLVLPAIVGGVMGLTAGKLSDTFIDSLDERTDEAITNARKTFQAISSFGPSVFFAILAFHIPEQPWVSQSLLTAAVALQSFNSAGYVAANQEKAGEKWTGLLYSITSLPSVWVGTSGVYLSGRILDAMNQDWSYVWGITSLVFAIGGLSFINLYDSKKEFD